VDIDPTLSLAFTIEANPGSYALLLGAGVSSGAVPTAWDILSILVERLAAAQGVDTDDSMAWYESTYGIAANYSDVLAALSPSSAGRVGLLRPFFEGATAAGSAADVGAPQPTDAHHAIARLMKAGYIKVVLTTNFDELLEQSLAAIGVAPTVLSTPSAMAGALPLHQQTACVIKIHGDYHDPSFLNTGDELASYNSDVIMLIDRILDDYGLIVCGWSATWDTALRHEIEARSHRRYVTYWVEPSEPSDEANRLIHLRDATTVTKTSSTFFTELEQAITSIQDADRPHPFSVAVAVANAKRHITSNDRVALHDLLAAAFNEVLDRAVTPPNISAAAATDWTSAIALVDGAMSLPLALVATVSRWGNAKEDELWVSRLMEMCSQPIDSSMHLWNLYYYPATLVLYTAGMGMVLDGRMIELEQLLRRTVPTQVSDKPGPLCSELSVMRTLSCLGSERDASQHVYDEIAPIFRDQLLISDESTRAAFDRLELLTVLLALFCRSDPELYLRPASAGIIRRGGSFFSVTARPVSELEAKRIDGVHPWIALGLFDRDQERFEEALTGFNSAIVARVTSPGNF